jgi:acyl carrier protein
VNTQARIVEILEALKKDPSLAGRVNGSSHLINDIGLDSLQLINLILLVEQEFEVEVDFETFEVCHLSSLDRFTDFIAGLARA